MAKVSNGRLGKKWVLILVGALGILALVVVAGGLGYWARGPGQADRPGVEDQVEAEGDVLWWACSMDTWVKLPEPGPCPVCSMPLIPLKSDGADGPTGLRAFATSEAGKALMDIQTACVERRFVTAEVRLVGKVAYDETRVGYITAWVPGRLDRLFVDYTGIKVNKGEHLAYIYSPELLSAQDELLQAVNAVRELQHSDVDIIRETAIATVQAARDKLRLLGLRPEQVAAVEERGTATDHITIYSPMTGTVVHKNAQEGMYVKTGARIYTIADLSRVWVILEAYESDLAWLTRGQQLTFTTEAYPGETFRGQIAFIDPVVDPRRRSVRVRVNVPNPGGKLKPEMFVRAVVRAEMGKDARVIDAGLAGKWTCSMHPWIVTSGAGRCKSCQMELVTTESLGYTPALREDFAKALVVPWTAVLKTGTRAVVYLKDPTADRPIFEGREIVLGPRAGDYYIVRHGLVEDDVVVTHGNFKIDSALQILAKPSMMTPEGGGATAERAQDGAEVPPHVRQQLQAVSTAYGPVAAAMKAEDLYATRSAFEQLEEALTAVDAASITGDALMMWDELSMLLGNDAFEGGVAKDMEEAREVLDLLTRHMERLREHFGLSQGSDEATAAVAELPVAFREQLGKLWQAYLPVQAALADDDGQALTGVAQAMREALAAVDMGALPHEARMAWMPRYERLQKALDQMLGADDLAAAREAFSPLSDALEAGLKAFGGGIPGPVCKLYCPMALGNKGATWLQEGRETRNPYFGAAMLGCGDVVETVLRELALPESEQEHDHE